MKTRMILASVAIPATAVGLLAQDTVVITHGGKAAEEGVMMAQGGIGIGFAGEPGNVRFMTQEFSFNSINGRVVTNAPYSAEEKTESVQTLADGTHITNTTTAHVYRDSQGRTRREMSLPGFSGDAQHTLITINDPVAGVNYTLDPDMKVAHQMPGLPALNKLRADAEAKLKAEFESKSAAAKPTFVRKVPRPSMKHEDLGGNIIDGLSVTGTREISTIETGVMGNDRPITTTSERWYSPELQVEVKSVHNDPRMGQTTHTLTNVSRSEPDASLFQVPTGYTLDEGKPGVRIQRYEVHSNQ